MEDPVPIRADANTMDEERTRRIAHEYLVRIGEAKAWIEVCIQEELPPVIEMEDALRNGVFLAKLARFFSPEDVRKIFDEKQKLPLGLRHSDNFNAYRVASLKVGLPVIYFFELTDLYDKKNMPKVIYMIHALSHFLFAKGLAPRIGDLMGTLTFTDEELAQASKNLGDLQLPAFGDIGNSLNRELGIDDSARREIREKQADFESRISDLIEWCNTSSSNFRDNMPTDDIVADDLSGLVSGFDAFKTTELPPRRDAKQRVLTAYQDIAKRMADNDMGEYEVDEKVSPAALESAWEVLVAAMDDFDAALTYNQKRLRHDAEAEGLQDWMAAKTAAHQPPAPTALQTMNSVRVQSLLDDFQTYSTAEKPTKQALLGQLKAENAAFGAEHGYVPPEPATDASLDAGWARLDEADQTYGAALAVAKDYALRREAYVDDFSALNQHANDYIAEASRREFPNSSQELATMVTEVQTRRAEADKHLGGLVDALATDATGLANDHGYTPPASMGVEDARKIAASVHSAFDDRERALKCKTYEAHFDEVAGQVRAAKSADDSRDFPADLAAVNQLLADLAKDRDTQLADFERQADALRTEYQLLHDEYQYTPPIGKALSDLEQLLAIFRQAKDNREHALNEQRKLLEDQARAAHFAKNEPQIEILQANIRGFLGRRDHLERMALLREHEPFWERIQAMIRGNAVRAHHAERMRHYREHEKEIIKIQAHFRRKIAQQQYKALMAKENTSFETIQRFVHLLDDSEKDFDEEIELERHKQQVVLQIRENQTKERELGELDVKIALLIRNRVSLDEFVESTKKFLRQQQKKSEQQQETGGSLKLLDRESRDKLMSYQHLFYLLQTKPHYLAKLMSALKSREQNQKFLEQVVLTLYSYAHNAREEYLLLSLFRDALTEEITHVSSAQELLRDNPVFINLIVRYTRGAKEQQFLHGLLKPLVSEILDNQELDLDVDPLTIYRTLIKDEESRTGQVSTLQYDISRSQALDSDEVMKIFVRRVKDLRSMTDKFITAIMESLPHMPYGIRYIARELHRLMSEKLGPGEEHEILKVVGHLIYYRYINPAIVSPDFFGVVESGRVRQEERKNLGEISKMLMQISVGKLFEDELFYLSSLNEFVRQSTDRFFNFFREVGNVVTVEEYFQVDRYDDLLTIQKPIVYMSTVQIYTTHSLLLEFREDLAPEASDHLNVILDELGQPPATVDNQSRDQDVTLNLTNRFPDLESEDAQRMRQMFVETKRMCLSVMRVQRGKTLMAIIESPVTAEQQALYEAQLQSEENIRLNRESRAGHKKDEDAAAAAAAAAAEPLQPQNLEQLKQRVQSNLEQLEAAGMVSRANGYQELLNDIAKEIRNKNRRRIQRRSELVKVRQTLENLDEKTSYLDEQKSKYQEYVDSTISGMVDKAKPPKKKGLGLFRDSKKDQNDSTISYSYTAERLFQKGVLYELENVPKNARSKAYLTISNTPKSGVYQIEGKLFGMTDTHEISIEDLLQKQFDNIQAMQIGSAKINVNLMIYLINKKFLKS
ncbi:hypothetical protein H696_05779 [Fonticula alba]|uniref:IQ domain-containing protein containing GTPase activating protein n=1 Tax=Fonticula alba TaxID=691883 RepID=A0A058Z073_FONAL|nr:hypothetical protein H696_05779 [Fonticula alba]KCV67669.1 hypothetical protein H696_05779 [Fonticula alba]|eukprot:XP_009497853.1 hypothetical protein H696_05779 [Fonticula alba]